MYTPGDVFIRHVSTDALGTVTGVAAYEGAKWQDFNPAFEVHIAQWRKPDGTLYYRISLVHPEGAVRVHALRGLNDSTPVRFDEITGYSRT